MIATDTFVDFARRMAGTQGCPHAVVAVTPNPVRGLDPAALRARVEAMRNEPLDCRVYAAALRARVEAMLPVIVEGFTSTPAEIERRSVEAAKHRAQPVRAQVPV